MKDLGKGCVGILLIPALCVLGFVLLYVALVGLTIPQLPGWAQPAAWQWMYDIPQNSEYLPGEFESSSPVGTTVGVKWEDYVGSDALVIGLPFQEEEIYTNHGTKYQHPIVNCWFHDPSYTEHIGIDFPMDIGTPVVSPMGGKIVWAGPNGDWGNLVVIENGDTHMYFGHLSEIDVSVGQVLTYGDLIGLIGSTGNSTGPHLHWGIKERYTAFDGSTAYQWLDPQSVVPGAFNQNVTFTKIPCE